MSNHYSSSEVGKRRGLGFYYALLLLAIGGHILSIWLDLSVGKIILGSAVIGYIPGSLLIRLLFRSARDLDAFERIVLSIVFSFILCTSLGLLLNLLPQGLSPSYIYLTIWGFIVSLFLLNLWGDRHQVSRIAPTGHQVAHLVKRVTTQCPRHKLVAYFVTGVVAALCLALLVVLIMSAENDERFTEFYVLSEDGTADPTLLELQAGRPGQFFLGISNHTRATQEYYAEVMCLGSQLFRSDTIVVQDGDTEHMLVSLQLPSDAAGTRLEIRLYMTDETNPVNTLYLQAAE